VKAIINPEGAKNLFQRSGTTMAVVLLGFREIEPDAPWWASLILAVVVLVIEQVFSPSQKAA
jgi:hypothetical protein